MLQKVTQALVRHKVSITAGTDALGACGMTAGFSLHKELETLNALGMTNSQVLRSATLVPAKWMNRKKGVIKAGFVADLLLLDHNPLEDIRHTRSIHAVISKGTVFDRQELDKMMAAVESANQNSRHIGIDAYLE